MSAPGLPRLVLDTNILLDLFFFRDPATAHLSAQLRDQRVEVMASDALIREFSGVLKRASFSLSENQQREILQDWLQQTTVIEGPPQDLTEARTEDRTEARTGELIRGRAKGPAIEYAPWKCRDKTDQMFLDLAYSCRPATLISKDKQVLKLAKHAAKDQVRITSNLTISYD